MATRKKPETNPSPTKDEKKTQKTINQNLNQDHLSKADFNSVVRCLKTASIDSVKQVRTETYTALKRLQVKRDLSKAVKGVPKGSDQFDVGSLVNWIRKVLPEQTKAVEQVIALDAVCCKRSE